MRQWTWAGIENRSYDTKDLSFFFFILSNVKNNDVLIAPYAYDKMEFENWDKSHSDVRFPTKNLS